MTIYGFDKIRADEEINPALDTWADCANKWAAARFFPFILIAGFIYCYVVLPRLLIIRYTPCTDPFLRERESYRRELILKFVSKSRQHKRALLIIIFFLAHYYFNCHYLLYTFQQRDECVAARALVKYFFICKEREKTDLLSRRNRAQTLDLDLQGNY